MGRTLNPEERRRSAAMLDDITSLHTDICRLYAHYERTIAEFAASAGSRRSIAAELVLALRMDKPQAEREISHAQTLVDRLPHTLAALETGEIDRRKAFQVVEATNVLDDDQARQADELLANRLEKTPRNLSRAIQRVIRAVDREGYDARCAKKRQDRKVTLTPQDHGMSTLSANIPCEVASAIYGSLTDAARAMRKIDKTRTTDQLRADILAERLLAAANGDGNPRTHVYVYVDLLSLLRLNNDPAYLAGYGDVPLEVIRERLFNPANTWSRLITDPDTGQLLSVGRTKYRPPADLDEFVRVRARTCEEPGCNQPAQYADIDHIHDWATGGETSADNLHGKCRHDHLLKNEPGWKYTTGPNGVTIINTPSGRTYTTAPEPLHEPRQPEDDPPPF